MVVWSQLQFLQALGWATLNSFWQVAILWFAYNLVTYFFTLTASQKYLSAAGAMFAGFAWFMVSFLSCYYNTFSSYHFFETTVPASNDLFHSVVLAASLTYLLLLIFPAARLLKNWRFVQRIKKEGVEKAALNHRLFVTGIALQLGIAKKVRLVVSELVSSPVTIGYLKPMILLPVASLNQLSVSQVEAILLHELAHIRRYDYLVNLLLSSINTVLYFNPFVRMFMRTIENEREICCDELVLQFGYDKIGYASALLHLEKSAGKHDVLTLAAAGKKNLLSRIEKIVGMEKKKTFRLIQVVPLLTAITFVLLFNSLLIINDSKKNSAISYTNDVVFSPWQLSPGNAARQPAQNNATAANQDVAHQPVPPLEQMTIDIYNAPPAEELLTYPAIPEMADNFLPVGFDDNSSHLSKEESDTVAIAINGTKKVVTELRWQEIEAALAELLDDNEKAQARQVYLNEVSKMNLRAVEQNLKQNYDRLNWQHIHSAINLAIASVQLDSLENFYGQALEELQKSEKELKAKSKLKVSPIPDAAVNEITVARQTLQGLIDSLKTSRPKKVIKL